MRRSTLTLAAVLAALPLGIALVAASPELRRGDSHEPGQGGQQLAATVFTAQQATAGSTVYAASCASCHMADLAGRNEAPQLAGNNFMNTWRNRSTKDLFEFIQSTMPPTGESLSEAQFLSVTAYILQANGAQPGATPMTPATAPRVRASGVVPTRKGPPLVPPGRPGQSNSSWCVPRRRRRDPQ